MFLKSKYSRLVSAAETAGIKNLQVREKDNVLYIDGVAPSEAVKKQLWDVYGQLDPDYRSADVVMNISVEAGIAAPVIYEVKKGDNLTKIGKQYGIDWKQIYEANRDQIRDPDLIQPGWKLKIPSKP
jgi:nucleoid-associated protein YgaU